MNQPSHLHPDNLHPDIIATAIHWFVRSASGTMAPQEELARNDWLAAHPDHELAWQRMHGIAGKIQQPARMQSLPVLHATLKTSAQQQRRRVLKGLAWAGTVLTSGWLLKDEPALRRLTADHSTAIGEQRQLTLAEGTALTLDSNTLVNIDYSNHMRRVTLLHGRVMINTAADAAGRPFVLATRDGELRPVGTRFSVSRDAHGKHTHLAVTAGAVEIYLAGSQTPARTLLAGQETDFYTTHALAPRLLSASTTAWADGMLSAERMPLAEFIQELARYHQGWLHCNAAAGQLLVTGTYPLTGPDASLRILQALQVTLPISLQYRTRYWVGISLA